MRNTISALALSPAIDKTVYVEDLKINSVNHAHNTCQIPGSKGVNVARNLAQCSLNCVCFGFIGGESGKYIENELENCGVVCDFVEVDYDARTNIKLVDLKNSTYTDINLDRGTPSTQNIEKLKLKTKLLAKKSALVSLSGTVPPGVDSDIYYELAFIAKDQGARVAIDCCGEPLLRALEAKPFVIKPNIEELEMTFKERYDTIDKIVDRAMDIYKSGTKNVLISLGVEGAVAVCEGDVFRTYTLDVPVYNTVGAGDAFLSGFIYGVQKGFDIKQCLKHSISFSQAVVSNPIGDARTLAQFTQYVQNARVEPIYIRGGELL